VTGKAIIIGIIASPDGSRNPFAYAECAKRKQKIDADSGKNRLKYNYGCAPKLKYNPK
jgi:hypothetical protein